MFTASPVSDGLLAPVPGGNEITRIDSEVVELALLLPRWQAEALEEAAYQRGLTAGQMLRRLVSLSLRGPETPGR